MMSRSQKLGPNKNKSPLRNSTSSEKFPLMASKAPMLARSQQADNLKLPRLSKTAPIIKGSSRSYRYKLYPGNNSRAVMMAIHRRPWWHMVQPSTDEDDNHPESSGSMPHFIWEMYRNNIRYKNDSHCNVLLNHIQNNNCLVTKKGLYYCIKAYCKANNIDSQIIIPRTFFLSSDRAHSTDDMSEFLGFLDQLKAEWNAKKTTKSNSHTKVSETQRETSIAMDTTVASPSEAVSTETHNNIEIDKIRNTEQVLESSESTATAPSTTTIPTSAESTTTATATATSTTAIPMTDVSDSLEEDPMEGSLWILKPASRTNRGYGIKVIKGLSQVLKTIHGEAEGGNEPRTEVKDVRESKRAKKNSNGMSSNCNRTNVGINADSSGNALHRQNMTQTHNTSSQHSPQPIRSSYSPSSSDSSGSDPPPPYPHNEPASRLSLSKAADRIAIQQGWIVQQYMERPLLVGGRKFDIRCFVLLTLFGKQKLKAYFFRDMYVRTSCKKYSLSNLWDRETHLTNDAVQKYSKNYGKFESGNKLTMDELQEVINRDYPGAPNDVVRGRIIPEIHRLSKLSVSAASAELSESSINKSFELLGYDYMIDDSFRPYLIEINSNPCLEFACPLLTELISSLVDNVMTKTLDPLFPPPSPTNRTKTCQEAVDALQSIEDKFFPLFP